MTFDFNSEDAGMWLDLAADLADAINEYTDGLPGVISIYDLSPNFAVAGNGDVTPNYSDAQTTFYDATDINPADALRELLDRESGGWIVGAPAEPKVGDKVTIRPINRFVSEEPEGSYGEPQILPNPSEPAPDPVNHPAHYTAYNGIEVIQLTEQMNFNRGNAVKYIARAGIKDPATEIQDLEKAAWYINREIRRLNGDN